MEKLVYVRTAAPSAKVFDGTEYFVIFHISIKTYSLKYVPTVPIVGVGKGGPTSIGPWGYLNRKLPFIELP